MNKQTVGILCLSISAAVLLVLNFALQQPAEAGTTVRERDYQLATTRLQDSGEALFVMDNRTGIVAVFSYDANTRGVVLREAKPVSNAFR
jgi:hypothetical protein